MELVGYQLIQISTNNVISAWGGVLGQTPPFPLYVALPNNIGIHSPVKDVDYYGYKIVDWMMEPPPLPPPVIPDISDRQFFQQAALAGMITDDEALLAVQIGSIPNALLTVVNSLPIEQQFAAKMLLSGATIFKRNHPMVDQVRTALGMTSEQIDQFFLDAFKL